MPGAGYSVDAYVSDIRRIAAEETEIDRVTSRIKPLAAKLVATPDWLTEEMRGCNSEQGFGVHLLHEEPTHDLAVFVLTWLPGRGTKPHNHLTWAVVAGIEGEEHEVNWERVDDGTKPGHAELVRRGEHTLKAGDIAVCLPHHIHSVFNTGDTMSISLHTYGRHINYTGRSEFDPEAGTVRPMVVSVSD